MDKAARLALQETLRTRSAELLVDIERRRIEAIEAGDWPMVPHQPQQMIYREIESPIAQPSHATNETLLKMADEFGGLTGEMEQRLRAEIAEVREQVALLRVELTVLRASIANGNVKLLGARDVA